MSHRNEDDDIDVLGDLLWALIRVAGVLMLVAFLLWLGWVI